MDEEGAGIFFGDLTKALVVAPRKAFTIIRSDEYGFRKVAIQSALDCNDGFFNMPIKLKIKLESRNE